MEKYWEENKMEMKELIFKGMLGISCGLSTLFVWLFLLLGFGTLQQIANVPFEASGFFMVLFGIGSLVTATFIVLNLAKPLVDEI